MMIIAATISMTIPANASDSWMYVFIVLYFDFDLCFDCRVEQIKTSLRKDKDFYCLSRLVRREGVSNTLPMTPSEDS